MLARVLLSRNQAAAAAQALRPARGKLYALEQVGEELLGQALLLSGASRQAEAPLRRAESLGSDRPAGLRAAALLTDALHEAGDDRAAVEQAAKALALPGQPAQIKTGIELTRTLALAAIARVDAAQARAPGVKSGVHRATLRSTARAAARVALTEARAFWLEHPDHPAAAQLPALEQALGKLAIAPLPSPSGRELGLRASRLLAGGEPGAAVLQAREALRLLSGATGADVQLLLARALAADGRRADAAAALESAWTSGAPGVAAAAGLLLARDRARRGKSTEAVALLDELVRRHPDAPEAGEAAYLAARLLLEEGTASATAARERLGVLAAKTRGPHTSDARWTLAWLAFKGEPAVSPNSPAAELFAAFAAGASSDAERAQGLYWQARASDPPTAAPLYARAAALDPLGWYGLLAAAGRAKVLPPPFPPPAAAPLPRPARGRAGPAAAPLALAEDLLTLGLAAESAAELDRYVQEWRGHTAALLPALDLYQRAGRYDRSMLLAENLLAQAAPVFDPAAPGAAGLSPRVPGLRAVFAAAYPAAWPDQVAASAQRSGLDPYFVLAIARRESRFRADARSAAGAVGLLQLTPATARRAAAILGRPAGEDDALFDPGNSIDLGSWYLSELVGRFSDPAIAAAAYNAGPRAVAKWASAAGGERLDEWVEDIPFRETRAYVKAVGGAWSAYRILAGGAPPVLAATVPAVKSGAEF